MEKILALFVVGGLLTWGRAEAAPPADVRSFIGGLQGQTRWLRIDVVRVQYPLRGEDATNVYPDGLVRYQMRLGIRRTESTSAEEFIRDAQRSLQQNETEGQVRVANTGTKVTISMTKVEDKEMSSIPRSLPITVTTGMRAFRSPWTYRSRVSPMPFALAAVM